MLPQYCGGNMGAQRKPFCNRVNNLKVVRVGARSSPLIISITYNPSSIYVSRPDAVAAIIEKAAGAAKAVAT